MRTMLLTERRIVFGVMPVWLYWIRMVVSLISSSTRPSFHTLILFELPSENTNNTISPTHVLRISVLSSVGTRRCTLSMKMVCHSFMMSRLCSS